jgi:hypothetical protein
MSKDNLAWLPSPEQRAESWVYYALALPLPKKRVENPSLDEFLMYLANRLNWMLEVEPENRQKLGRLMWHYDLAICLDPESTFGDELLVNERVLEGLKSGLNEWPPKVLVAHPEAPRAIEEQVLLEDWLEEVLPSRLEL